MMRVMLVFVRLAVQDIVVIKFCCVLVDQSFLHSGLWGWFYGYKNVVVLYNLRKGFLNYQVERSK